MLRWQCFILMTLILSEAAAGAETHFVDGAGSENFTSIQDAINASEAGGEIIVLNGTYRENLVVDRPITLRGEGMPVVSGGVSYLPFITINASGVVLDGFVFAGCTNDSCDSASVRVLSDGSKILNNTIYGSSSHGICVLKSTGHLISSNRICDNFKAGIRLAGANDSQISDNEIRGNGYGIYIEDSSHDVIAYNDISASGADGIAIIASLGQQITGNAIHNNSENGIYHLDSHNSLTVANTIQNCKDSGIYVARSFSTLIVFNNIERCGEMGINLDGTDNIVANRNVLSANDINGISILGSSNGTISNNIIQNNRDNGISLRQDSTNNIIANNTISDNKRYGLILDESDLNFIQANQIHHNANGIVVRYSADNSIVENVVRDNGFGLSLDMVDNVVVSKNEIANSSRDGISLIRCDGSKIWANRILDSAADGVHVIRSTAMIVSDNDILRSGEYGVQVLDQSTQNLFLANLVQNSGMGGIYLFEGDFNLASFNALIDNNKFNGWDNNGNLWDGNYYSDHQCGETFWQILCTEPYEIRGQRGETTLDRRAFSDSNIALGR
ncbi:MAG: right-handed parallel beta-helix repeat-containing protein [Methanothrix sp.]|uniref:Cell surface protein n=1 Tax=Methanothrix harundinacea TaxID=301375 RepID=A0A124FM08_9EURY|nr:MAG: Cell surface protein [Methanothrix harundinacea]KUK94167.1 MAG: Cell surface protein [Methanothrix harundinacea]MDD3710417.1 right-handed parallel beta-helix repeat-containing protein [Methanothrix sp.]MDI9398782.1 right-handed parallel beta-helix repeat-containing protein [Euryarchaeota archaeon]